jgi:hypothetical protein
MKKLTYAFLVGVSVIVLCGCATLFTGTRDNVSFSSDPSGASIIIEGIEYGKTPATISVKRPGIGDKQVTLKLEGYEPQTFILQKEFNAVAILNLGDAVGWLIDLATGSLEKYSQLDYNFKLKKAGSSVNIADLKRDKTGNYLISSINGQAVSVMDEKAGVAIVFEK